MYIGEEATAVGVCAHLKNDDYITSTHRGHGHFIAQGGKRDRMMAELFAPHDAVQVVDMRCGVRGVRLMQVHLTPRRASRQQWREEQLGAIARRSAMPSCVMTGVDAAAADGICAHLGATPALRPEAGGVLLGSGWPDAKVRVLPPLAGVSDHVPVLVKLPL